MISDSLVKISEKKRQRDAASDAGVHMDVFDGPLHPDRQMIMLSSDMRSPYAEETEKSRPMAMALEGILFKTNEEKRKEVADKFENALKSYTERHAPVYTQAEERVKATISNMTSNIKEMRSALADHAMTDERIGNITIPYYGVPATIAGLRGVLGIPPLITNIKAARPEALLTYPMLYADIFKRREKALKDTSLIFADKKEDTIEMSASYYFTNGPSIVSEKASVHGFNRKTVRELIDKCDTAIRLGDKLISGFIKDMEALERSFFDASIKAMRDTSIDTHKAKGIAYEWTSSVSILTFDAYLYPIYGWTSSTMTALTKVLRM